MLYTGLGLVGHSTFCADPGILLPLEVQTLVVPPGCLAHRRGCLPYRRGRLHYKRGLLLYRGGSLCVPGFCLQTDSLAAEGGCCKVSVNLEQICEKKRKKIAG